MNSGNVAGRHAAQAHEEWRKLIAARVSVTLAQFAPKKPETKE